MQFKEEGRSLEEELEKDSGRDMTPRLIGETWRKYPTETSTQKATYGLFECQYCKKEFEAMTKDIKGGTLKVVVVMQEKSKLHMV